MQKIITFLSCAFLFPYLQIAQQTKNIDFLSIKTAISIDAPSQKVSGKTTIRFKALEDTKTVSVNAIDYDKVELLPSSVAKTKLSYEGKEIVFKGKFKQDHIYQVDLKYETFPKQAMYFWGWDKEPQNNLANAERKQIWTQGQGKNNSHWMPSIDDINDKIYFDLEVDFDKDYEVIAGGDLMHTTLVNEDVKKWYYKYPNPISSYLVALTIGKYDKITSQAQDGTVLENYIYPDRADDYEATYKHTKENFDFLNKEFGIGYPWGKTYRQVPLRDFLYAGMENAGCTLYSDELITTNDDFLFENYTNVEAHELAHQWFGNIITQTESHHHWLHEGMATYYALLCEKEIYGSDYFWWYMYQNYQDLVEQNKNNASSSLISNNASGLTYYKRGAWAVLALERQLGTKTFKKCIHSFLKEYAYENVTTLQFLEHVSYISGQKLRDYSEIWLFQKEFPSKHALEILEVSSPFFRELQTIEKLRNTPIKEKKRKLLESVQNSQNPFIAFEIASQVTNDISSEALTIQQHILEYSDIRAVNILLSGFTKKAPELLLPYIEKYTDHPSRKVSFNALKLLWKQKANESHSLLEKYKEKFTGKDQTTTIETVDWYYLTLATQQYSKEQKEEFITKINNYTSPNFELQIQQRSFEYLVFLNKLSDQSLIHLSNGTSHPNTRFSNTCKQMMQFLMENPEYEDRLKKIRN